ncbi:hypothetical protein BV898_05553 [Hypsibius exemplaris]|uniref:Uncharacterized protein n=1 Tax=Hypsibius exemplaris TaxID=2072580 RepID=A0A1W0WZ85_HYPEX|nr:hypothetical protein BV898_05553 [Hypsibius exemplaris]
MGFSNSQYVQLQLQQDFLESVMNLSEHCMSITALCIASAPNFHFWRATIHEANSLIDCVARSPTPAVLSSLSEFLTLHSHSCETFLRDPILHP